MEFEVDEKNEEIKKIKIFYLYINNNNELYNVRSENEYIKNNCLSKERLLYLIKKNQLNLIIKHKLVSLLKFNIDLNPIDLNKFINNKININYLSSLKMLDTINFNGRINILKNFNSIFLIFINNTNLMNNTTKKINIKMPSHKTRRKMT